MARRKAILSRPSLLAAGLYPLRRRLNHECNAGQARAGQSRAGNQGIRRLCDVSEATKKFHLPGPASACHVRLLLAGSRASAALSPADCQTPDLRSRVLDSRPFFVRLAKGKQTRRGSSHKRSNSPGWTVLSWTVTGSPSGPWASRDSELIPGLRAGVSGMAVAGQWGTVKIVLRSGTAGESD